MAKDHKRASTSSGDKAKDSKHPNSGTSSSRTTTMSSLPTQSWLLPTSSSRRGRGSVVWRFFDFDGPERARTICRVCGHAMTWDPNTNSTSNMLKHCRNKHSDLVAEEAAIAAQEASSSKMMSGFLQEDVSNMGPLTPLVVLHTGVSSIEDRMSSGEGGLVGGVSEELTTAVSPETVLGAAAIAEAQERDPTPQPTTPLPPPKPESYQLRHNNHLTIVLEALAQDESFMDVTLTAQGRSLKAHKSVLSAVSPYFRGVLRENPCQHPIIIMPRDVRYEELYSIVNYIYKGEMTVAADDLTSLLKTAEILQVSGLAPSSSPSTSMNPNLVNPIPPRQRSGSISSLGSPASAHKPRSATDKTHYYHNINPADFMDVDMTCVKEEVASGDEDESGNVRRVNVPSSVSTTASASTRKDSETLARSRHNSTDNTPSDHNINKNSPQTSAPNNSPTSNTNNLKPDPDEQASLISNPNSNLSINSNSNSNDTNEEQVISEPFICPHCQEGHRGYDVISTHLRLKHPTKPSFLCICGRVFLRQSLKQAHARVCSVGINN